MPYYTAWNGCVEPETPECVRTEAEVRAKLTLAKHVVDGGHLAAKLNGEQGLIYAQAPFFSTITSPLQ